MSLERTDAKAYPFSGTSSAVKITSIDIDRTYIAFYAVLGNCLIKIGDGDFDTNAIKLEEGTMWEPKKVLTQEVWYKGAGTKLTVIL